MSVAPSVSRPSRNISPPTVWDQVVCGIDGTAVSLAAAREVAFLMPRAAQLTLCAIVDPATSEPAGVVARAVTTVAEAALGQAIAEISPDRDGEPRVRAGAPIPLLLDEVSGRRASLVAVGRCARARATGLALGSVARAMLHDAPCSVLIAHGAARAEAPAGGEVLVVLDASASGRRALEAGQELTERLSLTLRVGFTGAERDLSGQDGSRPGLGALLAASTTARLLIIGKQHRRGVPTFADLTEWLVRRAACPVLVVD